MCVVQSKELPGDVAPAGLVGYFLSVTQRHTRVLAHAVVVRSALSPVSVVGSHGELRTARSSFSNLY